MAHVDLCSTPQVLESLFEKDTRPVPAHCETTESAFDAVASRRKAMEMAIWPVADMRECYEHQIEFQAMAIERKLSFFQLPDDDTQYTPLVRSFAFYPENAWRAIALTQFLAVYRKELRWSREAEDFQSFLLGYSEDERRSWLMYNDWRQLGWNGLTIFLLMNEHSATRCHALANRCLDPALANQEILAAFPRQDLVLQKGAFERLPVGTSLARAAVPHAFVRTIMGSLDPLPEIRVRSRMLTCELIDEVNHALVSSLQFLTAEGWR